MMTHRTPSKQIAVVRFAGRGARLGVPALILGLLPAAVIVAVILGGQLPQSTPAWFGVVLGCAYSAAALAAAVLRFLRTEPLDERSDGRVDEPLSEALRKEGISESTVRRLSHRKMRRLADALGKEPPRLWLSSRLTYLPSDTADVLAVDSPRLARTDTPASFRGYVVVIFVGTAFMFAGTVCLLVLLIHSNPPSTAAAVTALLLLAACTLLPALWWMTRFSAIALSPGEIVLHRRCKLWLHNAMRMVNMTTDAAPSGGRSVNPASVRVVVVLQPVPPTTREEMQRAIFNTTGRMPERVYFWVFIGRSRPRAFSGVDIETWYTALYAQPRQRTDSIAKARHPHATLRAR